MRKTGIDIIGDSPWGTHLCHFYRSREDLIDILVPYFKAGLENNEFCMWVTSEPLRAESARTSLGKVVGNLDNYIKKGQIEILDASQWYTKSGKFEPDKVLQGWIEKEDQALKRGFDGLRLTGNTLWLKKRDWKDFADYEAMINNLIGKYRMIAICSYSLDKCGASEVIDVVSNHQFALIRRERKWALIEITERKRVEEKIRQQNEFLNTILESLTHPFYVIDANNYLVRMANSATQLGSLSGNSTCYALTHKRGKPCDSPEHCCPMGKVKKTKKSVMVEHIHYDEDGNARNFEIHGHPIFNNEGNVDQMIEYSLDITERKRSEEKLRITMAELARSNAELEQFASIASHDLKEPLRMVASYVYLLAKRYKGRLDSDADEFITYAMDGTNRMNRLINDLLAYSRVGSKYKDFAPTDCEAIFERSIANLKETVQESGAVVTHDSLPTVMGEESQLIQLFQNLISNAIKFHDDEPPSVHVSAGRIEKSKLRIPQSEFRNPNSAIEKGWVFTFRDNGIGISPEFFERIFNPFQRLHTRTEFSGTGIGLAICKKIVERHNGHIWVDSEPGKGSRFYFTIPAKE